MPHFNFYGHLCDDMSTECDSNWYFQKVDVYEYDYKNFPNDDKVAIGIKYFEAIELIILRCVCFELFK